MLATHPVHCPWSHCRFKASWVFVLFFSASLEASYKRLWSKAVVSFNALHNSLTIHFENEFGLHGSLALNPFSPGVVFQPAQTIIRSHVHTYRQFIVVGQPCVDVGGRKSEHLERSQADTERAGIVPTVIIMDWIYIAPFWGTQIASQWNRYSFTHW